MTLFYVTSLCILLILPKGSIADCNPACSDPQVCDSDDTCKIKHGGSTCATSADCVKGAECDTTSTNCQCGGGYTVISDLCKIDVGGSCAGTNSTMCKTGLMCEADKCKIDVGGSCAGTNSSMCKTGLMCEADKCILKAGQSGCTTDSECTENSVCSTGTTRTCTCSANYVQQTSGLCSGVVRLTCSMFLLGIVMFVSKYFQ